MFEFPGALLNYLIGNLPELKRMSEGYYYKYTQTSWRTIVVLLGNHNAVIIFYTQNIHTEMLTEGTNVRYIFGFLRRS